MCLVSSRLVSVAFVYLNLRLIVCCLAGWLAACRVYIQIPNNGFGGSTCDDYTGHPCPGCPTETKFVGGACSDSHYPFVDDHNQTVGDVERTFYNQLSKDGTGMLGRRVAIQDAVKVPAALPAGEYVVGFRWDW